MSDERVDKQWLDRRTQIDQLLSELVVIQRDNNILLRDNTKVLRDLSLKLGSSSISSLPTYDIKFYPGDYGVSLSGASSGSIITCVINGVVASCIAKSSINSYERVVVVPGGSNTEPHVVPLSIVIKGNYGAIAQETTGEMITLMKGDKGIASQNDNNEFIASIKGDKGVVAQDSNNYLINVLKGYRPDTGNLETASLDEENAFKVVLHDPTDIFSNRNAIGMAELAARLGSIVGINRTGNVIWLEDFESPAPSYQLITTGTGEAYRTTEISKKGNCSVLLKCPGTTDTAGITGTLGPHTNEKFGISFAFSHERDVAVTSFEIYFYIELYDGSQKHSCILKYGHSTTSWNISDNGSLTEIFRQAIENDKYNWNYIKVSIDFSSGKYIKLIYNDQSYDISQYSEVVTASSSAPKLIFKLILVFSQPSGTSKIYVDNFVSTINES